MESALSASEPYLSTAEEAPEPTTAKGFGPRAGAYLIDLALLYGFIQLLGVIGFSIVSPVLALFGSELYWVAEHEYGRLLGLLDGTITMFLYFVPCEWLFGASLGKVILRMRVVQLDGRLCGFIAATVRGALRIVDQIVFGAVAASSMSRDPQLRQRVGDRAARTVVLDLRDPFIRNHRAAWRLVVALVVFFILAQVWVVVFLLGTGQYIIGERVQPVSIPAVAANLQGGDFSPAMDLNQESGPAEFTGFKGTDISERLFVSDEAVVQSRVMLFDFVLTDTAEDLDGFNKEALATEFEGSKLSLQEGQSAAAGDLGVIHKFTDEEAGSEGYVLSFRRRNALVRLIFYGPPGTFSAEQAASVAAIIDERLTASGDEGH